MQKAILSNTFGLKLIWACCAGKPSPNAPNHCEDDQDDIDDMASDPANLQISDVFQEEVDGCAAPNDHDYAHPDPVMEFIPQKNQAMLLKNSHYNDHVCPTSDKVCL